MLAFDELYKRCSAHVAFVCQKFCSSKEDAEEVVQDTFLIAFKKAGMLRSETLMAYLRKIAIHESLRKRNINLRLQNYVVSVDDAQTENHPEHNTDFLPEEHLQHKESRAELLQIIKSLPKRQWEMIYMYYYAGFSAKEIADLMDCTENTVHKTLSNARKTIKSKLEGMGNQTSMTGMAPLAALLFMEEQVFAASYIPVAPPHAAATVAQPVKGYVIAASILAIGCAVAVLYFALRSTAEGHGTYEPYAPAYEMYTPVLEDAVEGAELPTPPTDEAYEPVQELETEPEAEPEAIPEQAVVPTPEAIPEPAQEEEPAPEVLPELETEPEPEEVPEPEPIEEPDPEPIHIDRTPEILAALAIANMAGDVDSIIGYYGFELVTSMRSAADMLLRFYVLDDGSGDILIGMAAYADGTGWRMNFEHYYNSTMPLDMFDLLGFMEG